LKYVATSASVLSEEQMFGNVKRKNKHLVSC
jgi:hypothetical protein